MERVIDFSYQAVNPFGIWDQADMSLSISSRNRRFFIFGGVILILLGITY